MSQQGSLATTALRPDRFSPLFETAPSQAYAEGTTIFKQGAAAQDVYRLDCGLVKIVFLDPCGEEVIVSLCAHPGVIFGDVCAILGHHLVSARVVTRDTHLRRVPVNRFTELIRCDAALSWGLHLDHCQTFGEQVERTAQLCYLPVRQRIENLIWKLLGVCEATPTVNGPRIKLPLKYRDMAQLVAVSPEHLCRVLGMIEKDGLILRDKGWLYVYDRDRLWHTKARAAS